MAMLKPFNKRTFIDGLLFIKILLLGSDLIMRPLLPALQNTTGLRKGIAIIRITTHGFINRLFAAPPDADGVFGPFIATASPHTNPQTINVSNLLRRVPYRLPEGNSAQTVLWLVRFLALRGNSVRGTEPRSHRRL